MRVKLLKGQDDTTVVLTYADTADEYRQALEVLGRPAWPVGDRGPDVCSGSGPGHAPYVVTTATQRTDWGLPDLTLRPGARVVDEARALDLLHDGASQPHTAATPFPGHHAHAVPSAENGASVTSALDRALAVSAPGARLDAVLGVLEGAGVPRRVRETLTLEQAPVRMPGVSGSERVRGRLQMLLALPWQRSDPQGFDRARVAEALHRTHGALDAVKIRILRALASCPQTCDLLTVERPCSCRHAADAPPALVVRPGFPQRSPSVLCLAGPRGIGKTSLAVAVSDALGRTHTSLSLGRGSTERLIRGSKDDAPGGIVRALCDAGVNNPVFIIEAVDRVAEDDVQVLLAVLDPQRRSAFKDAYLDAPFDLASVLWLVTAADAGAIPSALLKYLDVVELPPYTEKEKLAIAQEHLLKRPFDGPAPASRGLLAPESALSGGLPASASSAADPVVLVDRPVASLDELEMFALGPPPQACAAEASWRMAASRGDVRFEPDALRRVIRHYTNEAGVADLDRKLAEVCREAVRSRSASAPGPQVVTAALVPQLLRDGSVERLPSFVLDAIATERRRLSSDSTADSTKTNDWIEWLEHLPWTRRNDAPIDLVRIRAALDARQAGLEAAKACVIEHLAVRKRNPAAGGAVLCFVGPPGVGKTSLAQSIAAALGRRFAKLSCGGLRDETDLRGHNRTWKDAQPGSILRELRRVGYRDPVFVLDEIDKIGFNPAAVLLEVLDPAQQGRFRDAFVELPFDLSAVFFITTANDWNLIPPALRDRLEAIELPGYTESEKIAIATSHLVPAENQAAGLGSTPLRFSRGALEMIVRDHTSEPGIRQLARHIRTVCRKVALGRETGDRSLIRRRITVAQVRKCLSTGAGHADGLDSLCRRLDAPGVPSAVRLRGREVYEQMSGWARSDPACVRSREYLECLAGLPWNVRTAPRLDLVWARKKLDEAHAGHAGVKEQLLDHVAVHALSRDGLARVICLVGSPGVGKTSLALALARAIGRVVVPVDCAELDSAEALRGARGGRPGRILTELRRVGVKDPAFVLDEVDRLGNESGLPAALLEVLDWQRRPVFRDRYLELSFDLSEAVFLATATRLGALPPALRERFAVVEVPGYTEDEKRIIAAEKLLPMVLGLHGLSPEHLQVTDAALRAVIRGYPGQAGVWSLAGALGTFCRKVARRWAEGDEAVVVITPETAAEMLGAPTCPEADVAERTRRPGVAVGLGWTLQGGDLLFVEVGRMPGAGGLTLTGSLGDSMQESARAALSWLRANAERYGIEPSFYKDTDVHVQVQAEAEWKDGPSAGVAMVAALVSAFTGRPVRGDLAMTGAITLSGQVLPVARLHAKVLAARRRGLTRVVLPRRNEKEINAELDEDVRRQLNLHYVSRIDELLDLVLRDAEAADEEPCDSTLRRAER